MHLIDTRLGENRGKLPVGALHRKSVLPVVGTFMLIDQKSVFSQGTKAVSVKLAGKKPLSRPERVGRINDDKVLSVFLLADKADPIGNMKLHADVIQLFGRLGKIFAAGFNNIPVDLTQVDLLNTGIL